MEFINFLLCTTKGLNNSKNYFVKKIKKKKNMEIENENEKQTAKRSNTWRPAAVVA